MSMNLRLVFLSILFFFGIAPASVLAAWATAFEVTLSEDTITAWEFVDVTIKAIDESGEVDENYTEDIFIEVKWFEAGSPDVVLPGWGYGYFDASDLWIRTYSKWLTIKKPGTYEIEVVDLLVDITWVKWSAVLKVNAVNDGPPQGTLTINTPSEWAVLSEDTVWVIATTSLPNTPIVLYMDDEKIQEWLSDKNWDISMNISGITAGEHTLLMNAVDVSWAIMATSWPVKFTYEIDHWALFLWVEVTPSNEVLEWDKVTVKITTADVVDSVTLTVGEWDPLPTSKISDGVFQKELLLEEEWTYPLDIWLSVDWASSTHEDVETITVKKDVKEILTLTYEPQLNQSKVDLAWTYIWRIDYFKVEYWMTKNNLDKSLKTTIDKWTILLTDPTVTWYAMVHPTDEQGTVIWKSSEIITIDPLRDPDPICWNKLIEEGEECDDGNTVNEDGCSSVCIIETSTCGNRKIEIWEECDDGNEKNGDWCSDVCTIEIATCGNRVLELWEECDDGNATSWDGCSELCKIEADPIPTPEPTPTPTPEPEICNTWWIALNTRQVAGRHYLYRDKVPNASKYYVYRKDTRPWSIQEMVLVGETVNELFEYPFDPNAQADQYAWYAVEAECQNKQRGLVGDVSKVKVWPKQTILILLFLTLLLRWLWKLQQSKPEVS